MLMFYRDRDLQRQKCQGPMEVRMQSCSGPKSQAGRDSICLLHLWLLQLP